MPRMLLFHIAHPSSLPAWAQHPLTQFLPTLNRIATKDRAWVLSPLNAYRLVLSALVLSAKALDEKHYLNTYYCRVGGVTLSELGMLEVGMLELLDFRAFVSDADLGDYLGRQGTGGDRGCCC